MNRLSHLPTASETLLTDRALLKRTDTKFVLPTRELPALLNALEPTDYGAVRHEGGATFAYETVYFDTPGRALLRAHHRGQRPRCKVRIRHHLSRQLSFFELKQKGPNDATSKQRIPIEFKSEAIDDRARMVLRNGNRLPDDPLGHAMRIGFERTMLVGVETPERISIDTALCFSDDATNARLEDLAIVEVKQARFAARSPIMRALRKASALELRVSKYVTGAQLIWPDIRLNRDRNRLRMLRRRIA